MSESLQVVLEAYRRLYEKHSYALKLLDENTEVEKTPRENRFPSAGFVFAQGKESAFREAISIFDAMIAELRKLT